jgi:hypothetical protein
MFSFRAQIAFILVMFLTLCAGWAKAATYTDDRGGCHAYADECHTVALHGGRVGETVRVCEKVRLVCTPSERQGTTTVTHIR